MTKSACILQCRLETQRELSVVTEEAEALRTYRLITQRRLPKFAIGNSLIVQNEQ